MVAVLWYRPSDWLKALRLLWGWFEGKGAIVSRSPFPVADSKEATPPRLRLEASTHCAEKLPFKTLTELFSLSSSNRRRVKLGLEDEGIRR
jgi:hypothetical protein